jgi:hypothetical protein
VGNISLQEFGIVGVFALAVVACFKLYTESVKRQLSDRDAELTKVREEKDRQIAEANARTVRANERCEQWESRAWQLSTGLHKSVEVTGLANEVAKGAVELAEKKAAQ